MTYPTLASWVRFKKVGKNEYIAEECLTHSEYNFDSYIVWFAQQLNGKRNPYTIDKTLPKEVVDELIMELDELNIIRNSRLIFNSLFDIMFTLWCPKTTTTTRLISFFANIILLITFLPIFIFSVYYFFNNCLYLNTDFLILGTIFGLIVGAVFHEFGHMIACLANGGRVFELGVMLYNFMPGAYVLLDESTIKNRMGKIQVNAAGIEVNLLLAGILLILSVNIPTLSGFFLVAAINNAFYALFNLSFYKGFDGISIMENLLNVDDLEAKANKTIKSKSKKKILKEAGINGIAIISICYTIKIVQIIMPLIWGIGILEVLSWLM